MIKEDPMNLILLGVPGAGKGTAAAKLSAMLNIPQISSGDIFRANISEGTELGKLAQKYIAEGALVPDEVTIGMVEERLSREDCENGFILDGFPRTIVQAAALDKFLKENKKKIDKVVDIVADENELIDRITNRRICEKCKHSFGLKIHDISDGVCPDCGGRLIQRPDDRPEVIEKRLKAYHEETEPLIEYYKRARKLARVCSEHTVEDMMENIFVALRIKGFKQ